MPNVTIDFVSFDPMRDHYALCLVEAEELPAKVDERHAKLKAIQDRIFDAFDAVVDGHLAAKFPETLSQTVRIQVDCPFGKSEQIEELVDRVASYLSGTAEFITAIKNSPYVRAVHVVTGHQLGRF